MTDLDAARECLGVLSRAIRCDELETRERAAKMWDPDDDVDRVLQRRRRREWRLHHLRCRALRQQIVALVGVIATAEASRPLTMIISAGSAVLDLEHRHD
jgi:hypothetical protein